ncbi:MAG TPA: acyl-CoA dehydrogenase family protein [Bacillota bacterium]|jgi:glutaryl-CoA dehydrogenase
MKLPDYYRVDDLLSQDERAVRDLVRKFVEREVKPIIGEYWLKGEFPQELIPKMAELGLFGPTLPEKYGGAALSYIAYGLMMQELERGDSGLRSFASVQSSLAMFAIHKYGSEEQRMHWLPPMCRGEAIGCFGLTEPDAGSDPDMMLTKARRTDHGWVISGSKRWITNGSVSKVAVVWAKDESGKVQGFLVEKGQPGYTTRDMHTKVSMRASVTSELYFDEVEVEESARLPGVRGLGSALSCLTEARFGIAFGAVGAAMDCFAEALDYSLTRRLFGAPLAAKQLTQEHLADMLTRVTSGQLLALRLGQIKDAGQITYSQVSLAKRENVRRSIEVARMARELLGANGITTEYCSIRHSVNLESVDTYEGAYEVHSLIVGRDLTGMAAF